MYDSSSEPSYSHDHELAADEKHDPETSSPDDDEMHNLCSRRGEQSADSDAEVLKVVPQGEQIWDPAPAVVAGYSGQVVIEIMN